MALGRAVDKLNVWVCTPARAHAELFSFLFLKDRCFCQLETFTNKGTEP